MSATSTAQGEFHCESLLHGDPEPVIQYIASRGACCIQPEPIAIILTGSFARSEGSVLMTGKALRVLGDMEFMVVFRHGTNLARAQNTLGAEAKAIAKALAAQQVECEVEFSAVSTSYFESLRPQIFGYELLSRGRTVWGDTEILARAPRFAAHSIPHQDAWRMLNNRIVEQLDWAEALVSGRGKRLLGTFYNLVKFQLDICTSLLVFAGRYEDSYAGRAAAFVEWSNQTSLGFVKELAGRVTESTAFKLSPNLKARPLGVRLDREDEQALRRDLHQRVIELIPLVHSVWCWCAERLISPSPDHLAGNLSLSEAVLRSQPWSEKLRGWGKVALMRETRRQPGFWRHTLGLFHRGSPRYLIYLVADGLYFYLPSVLAERDSDELPELSALLPVTFAEHAAERRPWWRLRANVLTGWRLFLRNHWA